MKFSPVIGRVRDACVIAFALCLDAERGAFDGAALARELHLVPGELRVLLVLLQRHFPRLRASALLGRLAFFDLGDRVALGVAAGEVAQVLARRLPHTRLARCRPRRRGRWRRRSLSVRVIVGGTGKGRRNCSRRRENKINRCLSAPSPLPHRQRGWRKTFAVVLGIGNAPEGRFNCMQGGNMTTYFTPRLSTKKKSTSSHSIRKASPRECRRRAPPPCRRGPPRFRGRRL